MPQDREQATYESYGSLWYLRGTGIATRPFHLSHPVILQSPYWCLPWQWISRMWTTQSKKLWEISCFSQMLLWMSVQHIFWPGKNKARASVNRVQIAFNTTSSTELLPSAPIAYEHAAPESAQFAYGLPWDPLVIHRVPKMRLCDSIHKTQQIQLRLLTPIGWTAVYRGGGPRWRMRRSSAWMHVRKVWCFFQLLRMEGKCLSSLSTTSGDSGNWSSPRDTAS